MIKSCLSVWLAGLYLCLLASFSSSCLAIILILDAWKARRPFFSYSPLFCLVLSLLWFFSHTRWHTDSVRAFDTSLWVP